MRAPFLFAPSQSEPLAQHPNITETPHSVIDPDATTDREERSECLKMHDLFEQHALHGQVRWLVAQRNPVSNGELYRMIADARGEFVQPALYEVRFRGFLVVLCCCCFAVILSCRRTQRQTPPPPTHKKKPNKAFGLTVIEAMTCGLPTFATVHGGPSEIIKSTRSGFHIDPYHGDQASWGRFITVAGCCVYVCLRV